jgi:hypothetical protein
LLSLDQDGLLNEEEFNMSDKGTAQSAENEIKGWTDLIGKRDNRISCLF